MGAGVVEEFCRLSDEGSVLGGAGDGDAAAAAKFEEAFVAELAECAQDGVGVDAEHGGEVFGGWESFAGFGFAVGDGAANLGGDLFVQVERLTATVAVDPARPATVYAAGASDTDGRPQILRSTNSGRAWATARSATTHL